MLNSQEKQRYYQQIQLAEIGITGQQSLKNARVLCVGAGGLGNPLSIYLTAAGIGQLGIIDGDQVELSNLPRQTLYTANDCGKSKAKLAQTYLQQINPYCKVEYYDVYLTEENMLEIISGYDIIADASDNFATRYLVSDACIKLNKTCIMASVEHFQGQIILFSGRSGPCYRCLFPHPKLNITNCNTVGILGTVPGILGCLQAHEILKHVLQIGDSLQNKLLVVDLLKYTTQQFAFSQSPNCPACAKQAAFA
jgi:molybdopterin/thiamine biosynthesis adenylyltransferase